MELIPGQFEFLWDVPDRGFVWDDAAELLPGTTGKPAPGQRRLAPPYLVQHPETTSRLRRRPLEDGTLFLEFASLEPTPEAILKFANKHGFLGLTVALMPANGRSELRLGESLAAWVAAIEDMHAYVQVWEMLQRRDAGGLGQFIVWSPDGSGVTFYAGGLEDVPRDRGGLPRHPFYHIAHKYEFADHLAKWRLGDVIEPARLLLVRVVSERLNGQASPRLLLSRKGNGFAGFVMPTNLYSAMWVQFYRAILGEARYRRCEICGQWMDVTYSRRDKRQHTECGWRVRGRRRNEKKRKARQALQDTGGTDRP
ncbi:MAG TPA: hypothetical protein GX515_10140 [Firmicutes bacterium]|nr:hypothetical protein [Bacillota bacterium]